MANVQLSIVLPAWNEASNLELLLPKLNSFLKEAQIQFEIIVVDGGSKDNSREICERNMARFVIQNERGYGGALMTGFQLAKGDYVATLDADGSHPPAKLLEMWVQRETADIFIGSRYVHGGGSDAEFTRKVLSWILNGFYRLTVGIPVRDVSSGFRLYSRRCLQLRVQARDFEFLDELLAKQYYLKCRIKEIPFHYTPRAFGVSHARLYDFGKLYLKSIARIRRERAGFKWEPTAYSTSEGA